MKKGIVPGTKKICEFFSMTRLLGKLGKFFRDQGKNSIVEGKNSILLHTTAKFINQKNVKNTEPPNQTKSSVFLKFLDF